MKRTIETDNVKRCVFDESLVEENKMFLWMGGRENKKYIDISKPKRATDHTFNKDVTCEHGIMTLRVTENLCPKTSVIHVSCLIPCRT